MAREPVLKKELLREIAGEVEDVLAQARSKGESLLQDAEILRNNRLSAERETLAKEMERRRSKATSQTLMEKRNALLTLRKNELDEVFREARKRLVVMAAEEPERFGELLWALFEAGQDLLPEGTMGVRLGEGGERIAPRLHKQGEVALVIEKGWQGLIIESGDGRVRCDYSFEVLLGRCRSELQAEIEGIVFEEEREG